MYNPPDADEGEFLELKNVGSTSLALGGYFFSKGITYTFSANISLPPNGFYVLAKNPAAFSNLYGFAPSNSVGYLGSLNNNGEKITVRDPAQANVFSVEYDDSNGWSVGADGNGFSLVPINPNSNPDPDNPTNWRSSRDTGGSPKADDPAVSFPPILVNELLAHTDEPQIDAVELFNPTSQSVNIGGWFLTDDDSTPMKYEMPASTIIPANGYRVFSQNQLGFNFSSVGEQVYLFSGENGQITGYTHGFNFDASENGVSFGRFVSSTGVEHFPAQKTLTLNTTNSYPLVGPVVISEIMYNPATGAVEYVELTNISAGTVRLYDPNVPANRWRLKGVNAVGSTDHYQMPANSTLNSGERALLVPIAPSIFRQQFAVPSAIQVWGPYAGSLSDSGETLTLQKPDPPQPNGSVPYIDVDVVAYNDAPPWATQADGNGASLARTHNLLFGDDASHWRAETAWQSWAETLAVDMGEVGLKREVGWKMPAFLFALFSFITLILLLPRLRNSVSFT
jgi:hypothetical protein